MFETPTRLVVLERRAKPWHLAEVRKPLMSLETLDPSASGSLLAVGPSHVARRPTEALAEAVVSNESLVADEIDAPLPAEEVERILYEMTDPLNRYYRYPFAKGLLPIFMRLPFTPNHITAFHAAMGLSAGVLIARGSTRELVIAFFLAEARMIFDCLDGVVARAKKLSSPYGRTIDEMGDAVGYIGMQIGTLIHVHRHWPEESLIFMLAAGLLVPGWMAMTYDYYKRTFASLLKGTNDGPAEELIRRSAKRARGGGSGLVVMFALMFEWLQTTLLTPFAIPHILERIRRETEAPGTGTNDPSLDALARGVRRRAYTPGFRRLLRFTSMVTGDNAITFFNFGLLTFALAKVEKTMILVGFTTFVIVALTCAAWVKRGSVQRAAAPAGEGR